MNKTLKLIFGFGLIAAGLYITKKMIYPVLNRKVTSGFGTRIHPVTKEKHFHNGVDFAGKVGDSIVSPFDGVVKDVYTNSVGGNQLLIKHINGYTTGYAHLNKTLVKKGDVVKQGQQIAELGKTGRVTGAHLHFTLTNVAGIKVDPLKYLQS